MYICICVQVYVLQGQRKCSGCPSLGWTSFFSQGGSRNPFLQKAGNGQSANVIFGLAGLTILSYNRWKNHIKWCKTIVLPRIMLTGFSVVQKVK